MDDPDTPPLTAARARLLLVGVSVFHLGVGVGGMMLAAGRSGVALLGAFVGAGIAVAGGGAQYLPSTPRPLMATAKAAGWPALPVTAVALCTIALSLIGVAAVFASSLFGTG